MAKALFIAEKPSVAQEFAKALGETMRRGDGFVESDSLRRDLVRGPSRDHRAIRRYTIRSTSAGA